LFTNYLAHRGALDHGLQLIGTLTMDPSPIFVEQDYQAPVEAAGQRQANGARPCRLNGARPCRLLHGPEKVARKGESERGKHPSFYVCDHPARPTGRPMPRRQA